MTKFVRAVFPMLLVLRLADRKEPVMDKLHYYVRRMDDTLINSKKILDELESMTNTFSSVARAEMELRAEQKKKSPVGSDSEDSSYDSDNSQNTGTPVGKTLGDKVKALWERRRVNLVTDFSTAGWMLCPLEVVHQEAVNYKKEDRDRFNRLFQKMFCEHLAEDSNELAIIISKLWEEMDAFQTKSDPYDIPYIWNANNSDLRSGKSHLWHKKNSLPCTEWLGKFACRVCSKIVGMGSAERNWGDVKHLKSAKRSHLGKDATEKQATIYGASCMADAALEREYAKKDKVEAFKFWDEADFDGHFEMLTGYIAPPVVKRYVKCYLEDWEIACVHKRDDVSMTRLLQKYGGLEFDDIDNNDAHSRIDNEELAYEKSNGWMVKAYPPSPKNEGDFEPWTLDKNQCLHFCLAVYYSKHPEKNVVPLVLKENEKELADYLAVERNKKTGAPRENNDSDDSDSIGPPECEEEDSEEVEHTNEVEASDELVTCDEVGGTDEFTASIAGNTTVVAAEVGNDTIVAGTRMMTRRMRGVTTANGSNMNVGGANVSTVRTASVARNPDLVPCGNCGVAIQPVHRCDVCNKANHVFCGVPQGEGYGLPVRCFGCV